MSLRLPWIICLAIGVVLVLVIGGSTTSKLVALTILAVAGIVAETITRASVVVANHFRNHPTRTERP